MIKCYTETKNEKNVSGKKRNTYFFDFLVSNVTLQYRDNLALTSPPLPSRSFGRRVHGLPEDPSRAVFANFNKIDKLDPESFSLWMQILRRVPGSVLWLLDPRAVDSEVRVMATR